MMLSSSKGSNSRRFKPSRWIVWFKNQKRRLLLLSVSLLLSIRIVGPLVLWCYNHSLCYFREYGVEWIEGPSHDMYRECPKPSYDTISAKGIYSPRICVTTLTDDTSDSSPSSVKCRDFSSLSKLTGPNRQAYCDKHGYTFVDTSRSKNNILLDPSRPPAWSKIRAVQALMGWHPQQETVMREEMACDWVFWMDADTLIMNKTVSLESLLPADPDMDLIVTYDRRFYANSGAWFIRNSDWSRSFLQEWWDMNDWVRPKGLSLSGDNAAFGNLVQSKLQDATNQKRIQRVPRCSFNSFGVFYPKGSIHHQTSDEWIHLQEWYLSDKFYHHGDFVAHASGIDQKAEGVKLLLARSQRINRIR